MSTAIDLVAPSVCVYPEAATSAGQDAIDIARVAGLHLDPWQCFCLERALAERTDGRWAAFEAALEVGRQNGKGGILEARELAGLFVWGERLLVHSAHEFATSREHQGRLEFLIQNTPELHSRVRAYKHAHGEEGIYLKDGRRLLFRTRTKGGGRGFSADFVAFDEAMILPEATVGALLPTLSARPNPQVWYAGSAVDKELHLDGVVFARLRERALAGDTTLAYFGWEFRPVGWEGPFGPDDVTAEMAADPASWAMANPALGIRITAEHIAKERRSMAHRTFAVERLGVGDWPETDPDAAAVIDLEQWRSLADARATMVDPVTFAWDVSPDRSWAAIAAAGASPEGRVHVEIVDHRRGTGWVPGRLEELRGRWRPAGVVYDERSQAASLADEVEGATAVGTADYVKACGVIFDLVDQRMLSHLGTPELEAAIRGAAKRNLGDAWAWSRRSSSVDISPLVAGTLAVHAATSPQTSPFFIS